MTMHPAPSKLLAIPLPPGKIMNHTTAMEILIPESNNDFRYFYLHDYRLYSIACFVITFLIYNKKTLFNLIFFISFSTTLSDGALGDQTLSKEYSVHMGNNKHTEHKHTSTFVEAVLNSVT